jgi:hypothetical protein
VFTRFCGGWVATQPSCCHGCCVWRPARVHVFLGDVQAAEQGSAEHGVEHMWLVSRMLTRLAVVPAVVLTPAHGPVCGDALECLGHAWDGCPVQRLGLYAVTLYQGTHWVDPLCGATHRPPPVYPPSRLACPCGNHMGVVGWLHVGNAERSLRGPAVQDLCV